MGHVTWLLVVCVGVLFRAILFVLGSERWLSERVELSTPINSWTRLKEGVALVEEGLSPYEVDIFHDSPLVLYLCQRLCQLAIAVLLVVFDILVGFCLSKIAKLHNFNGRTRQLKERNGYGEQIGSLIIPEYESLSFVVFTLYLLNPYTVLCCAAYSTQCFSHLAVVFTLWTSLKGDWFLCGIGLSLCTHFSLYPIMLLLPCSLMAYNKDNIKGIVYLLLSLLFWSIAILMASFYITQSWDFLFAMYGVILTVPDFTPNVGLFWYFFTEMFDHFRLFFICVFQINAFIHSIPLTITFSKYPMFLSYILLSLMAFFKSYPTIGDFALPLSLLPLWSYTFRYLRFTLIICGCILVSSIAGPILWYLWIHVGSANANFFFGMTITYNIAQVFLLLDMVNSYMSYQYDLQHGLPRLDKQGKPVLLKLQ